MARTHRFYIIPVCSILTFGSSIACLASKITASHSYNEATAGGALAMVMTPNAEFPDQTIALATYPLYLGLNTTTLVLVASSIALAVSIAFAALSARVIWKCKPVKLLWYHQQAALFVLFANASVALAAFINSFVLHGKSAHFSLFYRSIDGGFGYGGSYDDGVFDLETWACEVKSVPSFSEVSTFSQQCTAEVTGRACTAIMFVFAIGMFIAVWLDTKTHRALLLAEWDGDRMAWDDEDDCELDNVTTMRQLGLIGLRSNYAK